MMQEEVLGRSFQDNLVFVTHEQLLLASAVGLGYIQCLVLSQGEAEFLGRTTALPMVKLDPNDTHSPVLQWYSIKKGTAYGGELLAAFELLLVGGHLLWL